MAVAGLGNGWASSEHSWGSSPHQVTSYHSHQMYLCLDPNAQLGEIEKRCCQLKSESVEHYCTYVSTILVRYCTVINDYWSYCVVAITITAIWWHIAPYWCALVCTSGMYSVGGTSAVLNDCKATTTVRSAVLVLWTCSTLTLEDNTTSCVGR